MEMVSMKKDRNSFFNEASYSYGGYIPNNMMQPNMMPVQSGQYNQSFYSGPGYTGASMQSTPNTDYSDIESRLSKIERQLNRLDSRITKLETTSSVASESFENTTNMYMV